MKTKICQYLSALLQGVSEEELHSAIEIPPEEKMGDYALPCFVMAKKMHKSPMLIATELQQVLREACGLLGMECPEEM